MTAFHVRHRLLLTIQPEKIELALYLDRWTLKNRTSLENFFQKDWGLAAPNTYGGGFRAGKKQDKVNRKQWVAERCLLFNTGSYVARYLDRIVEERGKPKTIVCDNGTEFTSKAMFLWSKENRVSLSFIQPGKPTQNGFCESFNGKFRDGCLNQQWFKNLSEARVEIERWRQHYNLVRPHSSLDYVAPAVFANKVAWSGNSTE